MKMEASPKNNRAEVFKKGQKHGHLLRMQPEAQTVFVPEDFGVKRSIRHKLAISELYELAIGSQEKHGAACVFDKDGKEILHRLGVNDQIEPKILSIINETGTANIREICLMSTRPISSRAEEFALFVDKNQVRPLPPVLPDFIKGINFEMNVNFPVEYERIDARGLWKYSFDRTSDFIQRVSGGVYGDLHDLEGEFPVLKELGNFEKVINSQEYKKDPEDFLGKYIEACRSLGITLNFEPIEKFQ